MGVRDILKRMTASVEELDRDRRRRECDALGATPVAAVGPRSRAKVSGEVVSVRIVPRAGAPSLEVAIDDGYGRAVAVFFGRKGLGGLNPGRRLVVEGVAQHERGRTVFYNPAYTLL
ncbi:MAG: DNA-binding protein [Acidimicrobiia bacterium]|nr:DNA-binding protein [Acidimicrobiia bacterium]